MSTDFNELHKKLKIEHKRLEEELEQLHNSASSSDERREGSPFGKREEEATETLELETYTIAINVAGPDMEVVHTDAFPIRRTVEFPSDEITLYDNQEPSADTIEEDNLLIYPQPAAFSSGETLRMEVRGYETSANEICSIRMFDVRGRLVRSIYEGVYGEGLSLDIGLTNKGGEKIAPGLYIIVLEMGDLAQTRKIVLLK